MKYVKISLLTLFVLVVVLELGLRWLGFHSFPLYQEDSQYEYIQRADQDLFIYRNHFFTNSYGMRSKPVSSSKRKILLIGDSVLNGGNLVSNENLASTLLENSINGYFNTDSFQVLNISAGTWGPDNGMAFIKKHGDFDADLICLVYNSHDAGDTMEFKKVVGVELQKPDRNESIATIAFIKRMVLPKLSTFINGEEPADSKKMAAELNPGWTFFYELSNKRGIPLIVYLHATKEEAHNRKYDQEGQKIIEFCNKNNIRMVMDINRQSDDLFVDYIHLNSEGQKMITDILFPEVISQFEVASN